jgi:DNA polymerase elongation subunit (family B)
LDCQEALCINGSQFRGVQYNPYKLKIMGLEIVKASTPQVIRKELKNILPIIFEEGEKAVQSEIAKFKDKFMQMQPEEIAFPRSANDIEKWSDQKTIYKLSTPIHVRGALLYNKYVKCKEPLQNGDKIKFIYLKTPNPIKENCVSFPSADEFPKGLNLEKYIDWDQMFEKGFISPLKESR